MKLQLIKLFDWIDDKILRHRFYFICKKIESSKWWGETIEIELTDKYFLKLAKMAHSLDMTFNNLCVKLIEDYIKENKIIS